MSTPEDLLKLRSSEEQDADEQDTPSEPEAPQTPEPDRSEPAEAAPTDQPQTQTPDAPEVAETETVEAPQADAPTEVSEAEAAIEVSEADAEPSEAEPVEAEPQEDGEAAEPVETDEEGDEDDDEEVSTSFLFSIGDWYVVHTYAGYENKVRANLASRIQSMNMEDKIHEVVVPTEEVMELKSGKMTAVSKKVFPGYILVRMDLDDDSWYVVRNTPGVTGFVGPTGAKPMPLDPSEVEGILAPKAEDRPRPQLEYEEGEVVSVIGGAFSGYSGPVSAIDVDKQRVTVLLDLFGRETPVEVTFDQVTKL